MKKLLITLFICTFFTSIINAQGWIKNKGDGFFKLSETGLQSSKLLGPDGSQSTIRTTSIFTTNLYAEYGLSKKLTGIINLPFFVRSSLSEVRYNQTGKVEPKDAINSFGDVDIAFKYGIVTNKPTVVSVTILFGIPSGVTAGGEGKILQTGDGEFNQMVRFDVSHSFYPKPFYASAYSGFNNRTNGFSDEIRYGFDIGFTPKNWLLALHVNTISSLKNGSVTSVNNGIFSNNIEFIFPAVEVGYSFSKKFGLTASAGYPVSGKNVLKAPSFSGGIFYKLLK